MNSEIMHPTTDLLTDYIESPTASEFSDVRTHLINCKECRFEANRLVQRVGYCWVGLRVSKAMEIETQSLLVQSAKMHFSSGGASSCTTSTAAER